MSSEPKPLGPMPSNLEVGASTLTEFTCKAVRIPAAEVPKETTLEQLPRKPYWCGVVANAPFHGQMVGGLKFQKHTHALVNGQPANAKIGSLLQLSDEAVKKIVAASKRVAWRKRVVTKKMGKEVKTEIAWDRIDLDRAEERLLPGDKLTAHYIFIAALDRGQRIPLGVRDEDGKPLPCPKTLISE